MEAKSAMKRNKVAMVGILCGDHSLILNKCSERELINEREYLNLKSINKENVEGHVIELVDKIMSKGEKACGDFLELLQTDDDIQSTFPDLRNMPWSYAKRLSQPVQACSGRSWDCPSPDRKRRKQDAPYPLNSRPTGLCVILNNENFPTKPRYGTNKDAQSLAEVFSWLGFRVLMCKDQTKDQMGRALTCFASLSDLSQLQEFSVKEWTGSGFADLRDAPKHGDAFICCILSHGGKDGVSGIDEKPLSVKEILRTFNATPQSSLTGKPKVFLVQTCRGEKMQPGVLSDHLQTDDCEPLSIPVEADFLVAFATVEDYKSVRHRTDGTWFIQSVCEQLKEGCPRGDEMNAILQRVNYDVSQKEASSQPGAAKQMPEVRHTLRMSLVLSPKSN